MQVSNAAAGITLETRAFIDPTLTDCKRPRSGKVQKIAQFCAGAGAIGTVVSVKIAGIDALAAGKPQLQHFHLIRPVENFPRKYHFQ